MREFFTINEPPTMRESIALFAVYLPTESGSLRKVRQDSAVYKDPQKKVVPTGGNVSELAARHAAGLPLFGGGEDIDELADRLASIFLTILNRQKNDGTDNLKTELLRS